MKKLLSYLLILAITLGVMPSLVACEEEPEGPIYSEEYLYNDDYHWLPQLNGDGKMDYAEHYNPKGTNAGRCKCGYYFPCHNLIFSKIDIDGDEEIDGYQLVDYDEYMSPNFYHVEVPAYYQGEDDEEPLPVISIRRYALSNRASTATATYGMCGIKLESIKLNEGLLDIGDGAFCHSNIKEIVIPNSVKGELHYTFMQCSLLERIVIGDGVEEILGYVFYGLPKCEEIVLGNSIKEIKPRSFIDCKALKSVVLPASLISIPELSHLSNAEGCEPQIKLFMNSGSPDLFLNISEQELRNRTIPLFPRDENGNLLNPDGTIAHKVTTSYDSKGQVSGYSQATCTHWGLAEGWSGDSTLYYLGEWYYDENNKPVPYQVKK